MPTVLFGRMPNRNLRAHILIAARGESPQPYAPFSAHRIKACSKRAKGPMAYMMDSGTWHNATSRQS